MSGTTHFGFETVPEDKKESLVRGVFDSVASRYDLMNDLMSAGLHRWWKNEMVGWLAPREGMKILDVAGGTGDIAFRILQYAKKIPLPLREGLGGGALSAGAESGYPPSQPSPSRGEGVKVVVCDINNAMLEEGRNRAIDRNLLTGLEWICGNAESLPFPDCHFDAYTIAFGIRNVTHIDKALSEAHRVLKPGGRFLCLEFSHLTHDWLQKCYDVYSFNAIPRIGKMVTGKSEPYSYLVESIRQFPKQEEFLKMMEKVSFGNLQYRNMTQGVVAIHSGRRL